MGMAALADPSRINSHKLSGLWSLNLYSKWCCWFCVTHTRLFTLLGLLCLGGVAFNNIFFAWDKAWLSLPVLTALEQYSQECKFYSGKRTSDAVFNSSHWTTDTRKPEDSSGEISLQANKRFFFMSVKKYTLDLFKM